MGDHGSGSQVPASIVTCICQLRVCQMKGIHPEANRPKLLRDGMLSELEGARANPPTLGQALFV